MQPSDLWHSCQPSRSMLLRPSSLKLAWHFYRSLGELEGTFGGFLLLGLLLGLVLLGRHQNDGKSI